MLNRKAVTEKVFPKLNESLPEWVISEMLKQYDDGALLYVPDNYTGETGSYYCLKCKSKGSINAKILKCPHCGNSKARSFRQGYSEENATRCFRYIQQVDDGIILRDFKCRIIETCSDGITVNQEEHTRIYIKGYDIIAFVRNARWTNHETEHFWQFSKTVYDCDYLVKKFTVVSEVDIESIEYLKLLNKELTGSVEKLFDSLKIVVAGQTKPAEEAMPTVSFKKTDYSLFPAETDWDAVTKEESVEGTESFVRQHSWCTKCGKYLTRLTQINRRYYSPETRTCIQCRKNYGRGSLPFHVIDAKLLDDESVMLKLTCIRRTRAFVGELIEGVDPKVEEKNEVLFTDYIHVKLNGKVSFYDGNGQPIEKMQVFTPQYRKDAVFRYTDDAKRIIRDSKVMKRTGMNAFMEVNYSVSPKYLEYLIQMPCLEIFAKAGFYTLVNDILNKDINDIPAYFRKEVKASRFSGFTKPQIQSMKISDVTLKQFIVYMQILNKDPDALYTEYTEIASASHERHVIDILRTGIPGMTVSKIKEYMNRVDEAQCCSPKESMQLWSDYLRMLKTAECDLTDKHLIFPNSLKREHDKMTRKMTQIQDKELCADFADTASENEWLEYHGKTLSAVVPHNLNELYEEGRKLSHCVGAYAKMIVRRETVVAFVRKNSNPDVPYCTVEVRGKRIVQARGYSNRPSSCMPDVSAFLAVWAKEKGLKLDVA